MSLKSVLTKRRLEKAASNTADKQISRFHITDSIIKLQVVWFNVCFCWKENSKSLHLTQFSAGLKCSGTPPPSLSVEVVALSIVSACPHLLSCVVCSVSKATVTHVRLQCLCIAELSVFREAWQMVLLFFIYPTAWIHKYAMPFSEIDFICNSFLK